MKERSTKRRKAIHISRGRSKGENSLRTLGEASCISRSKATQIYANNTKAEINSTHRIWIFREVHRYIKN